MDDISLTYEVLEEKDSQVNMSFKLIVIGDTGVGKSSLTTQAIQQVFEEKENTIGFDTTSLLIRINNKKLKLQIWDTCGQEIYRSLITSFYKTTSLAVLVYSITDLVSFQQAEKWLKELKSNSNPDVKVILIGNKADLEANRAVSKEEGENFAKENAFDCFFEASAKTGLNAREVFITAAKLLYNEYNQYLSNSNSSASMRGMLGEPLQNVSKEEEESKKGCC